MRRACGLLAWGLIVAGGAALTAADEFTTEIHQGPPAVGDALENAGQSAGEYHDADHFNGHSCNDSCRRCRRLWGLGDKGCGGRRGQQAHFACGCNGSYKFPVPPLFTYHWPGMYSHELMTGYHSPWRFPPLKPYRDEPPAGLGHPATGPRIVPTSHVQGENVAPPPPREITPVSEIMRRMYAEK